MTIAMQPHWTDDREVQPAYALGIGGVLRTVTGLDLGGGAPVVGGYLFIGVGRSGTTALTNGVDVIVRRTLGAGSSRSYSAPFAFFRTGTACGARTINNAGGYGQGTTTFAFAGSGGTAFAVGDVLCFWGVTSIPESDGLVNPNVEAEFLRVSKGTATPVTVDRPCLAAKLHGEIFCQADVWNLWLPGGADYELIFDYGDDAAGGRVLCRANIQTYDRDVQVEE